MRTKNHYKMGQKITGRFRGPSGYPSMTKGASPSAKYLLKDPSRGLKRLHLTKVSIVLKGLQRGFGAGRELEACSIEEGFDEAWRRLERRLVGAFTVGRLQGSFKAASRRLQGDLKAASPSEGFNGAWKRIQGASRGLKGAWRLEAAEGGLQEGLKAVEGGFIFRRLEGALIRNGLLRSIFYTCPNLM